MTTKETDRERTARIAEELVLAEIDAVVAALPTHVLTLTGYWPVTGTTIGLVTSDAQTAILIPTDEAELVKDAAEAVILPYAPSDLKSLVSLEERAASALRILLRKMQLSASKIGCCQGASAEPASYAASHVFGPALPAIIQRAAPGSTVVPADDIMNRLRSALTPMEVEKLRRSCRAAQFTFESACEHIHESRSELEIANQFRTPLSVGPITTSGCVRADGYVYVMSGPNSARAYAAYARSQSRQAARGDMVLVHCNSYVDGFWTDITRTYSLGELSAKWNLAREAVFAAREAALSKIASGVRASDVDAAARAELTARGFGPNFKHSTGHGVGFAAFDPNALPRIHPASPDILKEGMAFNVEPAIYIEGLGGIRHCDMVAVTQTGYELLTPFQTSMDDMLLSPG